MTISKIFEGLLIEENLAVERRKRARGEKGEEGLKRKEMRSTFSFGEGYRTFVRGKRRLVPPFIRATREEGGEELLGGPDLRSVISG